MPIPVNLIQNEVHPLQSSRAVIPVEGAFFNDESLIVEGSLDGTDYVDLDPVVDYIFSPVFTEQLALTGVEVYSYILLRDDWETIRISYNVLVGVGNRDAELLTRIGLNDFDRLDLDAWLKIPGSVSYNSRSRIPIKAQTSELDLFTAGMTEIKEAIETVSSPASDVATNIQVTNLELRQAQLETQQSDISLAFNGVLIDFTDTKELFNFVEAQLRNGKGGNVITNGGYPYVSESPLLSHVVTHNLNTEWVDVTVWVQDINRVYHCDHTATVRIETPSVIVVDTMVPSAVMVIVRPVVTGIDGFHYTSPAAQITHTISHNLESGYLSFSLWLEDLSGVKIKSDTPVTMVDHNTITFTLSTPATAYAIVQKPLKEAYLYKSNGADTVHRMNHGLFTPQVTKNVWVQNPDGTYTSVPEDSVLETQNSIVTTLMTAGVMKAVIQPVIVADPTFEQSVSQRLAILEDGQTSINTQLTNIGTGTGTGTGGGLVATYNYASTDFGGPALNHVITHNFNSDLIDVTVWVQGADGFYYRDVMLIRIIDLNTVEVVLTEAANIKVEVIKR